MRDLFPGWIPPNEETLERYWKEATFAVDTSVLLDLYRFSEEARSGLLKALRSFEDRLWIPHQVALEFHRNRFGVLLDQREAEEKLLGQLDQIQSELDDQLSRRLRGLGRRDLALLREAVDGGFERLREKLGEAEEAHTKGLGDSIQEDPVYDEVVALCSNKIGSPFDKERFAQVILDAEERFRREIPPGYLDADKDEESRYGDVLLWHQLCDKAIETGKPIVLIADDQKTDWVWEVRGKTLGPRPELVAEMQEKGGVGFYLYTPRRLLQMWEKRKEGRKVEPEVLDEIEGSASDEPLQKSKADLANSLSIWDMTNRLGKETAKAQGGSTGDFLETYLRKQALKEGVLPVARNRVDGGSVVLELAYRPAKTFGLAVIAEVIDSDGKALATVGKVASPSEVDGAALVEVRYPEQFHRAAPLQSGRYSVVWRGLSDHGSWQGRRDEIPEIVRSEFIV
ncbi:MAG TPA: PIN-like domain-containing protein [Solirubrobacterales bacterium]|jgi:hypothetical protein|nr:PIN-like domain-containing protein [Solirubrobacterales bacterium]